MLETTLLCLAFAKEKSKNLHNTNVPLTSGRKICLMWSIVARIFSIPRIFWLAFNERFKFSQVTLKVKDLREVLGSCFF